ncbi:SMP-30/gluconolactonase/LRE family protein [Vibrio sonorensis]|uniref:SMP-30/gluconolactonase/LRE family protein n=1 Tax=Vibrio sonorensis TaxID=1004316 RepID=UPI0008D9B655|nr:SMP-30/gluconolactonase/LRE family protein [Vibrio sonorensis]
MTNSKNIAFEPLVELNFDLAECPRWDWRGQFWMWVNICEGELWRMQGDNAECIELGEPIGCFALHGKSGYILGLKSGIYHLESWESFPTLVSPLISEFPRMRHNDGRVAPGGRFIVGTRNGAKEGDKGQFYQLHDDGSTDSLPFYAWTCNGLAFSNDGQWLYWADTGSSKIYKHSYDSISGVCGPQQLFCDLEGFEGRPDGASIDAEGNYWVAMYAGRSIIKISPDGEVLNLIPVEVENPTMVGFGGKGLTDLVLTSAKSEDSKGKVLIAKHVVRAYKEPLSTYKV